jgi:hypothetical protein
VSDRPPLSSDSQLSLLHERRGFSVRGTEKKRLPTQSPHLKGTFASLYAVLLHERRGFSVSGTEKKRLPTQSPHLKGPGVRGVTEWMEMLVLMNIAKMFLAYGHSPVTLSSAGLNWSWFLRVLIPARRKTDLSVSVFKEVESSRASPLHRPRKDGFAHPADTSRPNLAEALALLSRRLATPLVRGTGVWGESDAGSHLGGSFLCRS